MRKQFYFSAKEENDRVLMEAYSLLRVGTHRSILRAIQKVKSIIDGEVKPRRVNVKLLENGEILNP